MKAIVLREPGGCEQLRLEEVEIPTPHSNQVFVKLKAAALNRRDILVRSREQYRAAMPFIPGSDGAGIVVAVGASVALPHIGDEVVIYPALNWGNVEAAPATDFRILGGPDNGTYAEYICISAENVFPRPSALSFEEAAAFPLACLTAWRALITKARVQFGEWVLIHGAGSGVASFAIQIAKFAGARVIVTSHSDEKLDRASALGANIGINYTRCEWDAEIKRLLNGSGVDVIIDSVGKETFSKSLDALNSGGRLVTFGTTSGAMTELDIRKLYHKQLAVLGTTMGSPPEFAQMLQLITTGKIRPIVDRVFALADAAQAHQYIEHQEQFGKIVLRIE
ncbi:MAG: zinc-binding dehydrogenase [Chloroflexi bacterium]|nr:zinc-binding dehydrogenase [Chloroflexota bacterium]